MYSKKLLFAAAVLSFLAACSSDDESSEPMEQRVPVALQYTTIDPTETRAAQNLNEETFARSEAITVRISNTGAGSWTNYDFTTGNAGAMSPTNTVPYYPAGSQNIDIVAYYPAMAGTTFTVQAAQTTDANYKASDLMFASVTNQAKQAEAVNLAFTHKLAKLCVNITAGQGVSSINSLNVLNVKPTVSFNQATGVVGEAIGDATSIAMSNNGAAVIPAQTINGGLLSIVTDKGTATYTVSDKAFESGKAYTINITVNLRAIGTTNAITDWTTQGTVAVVSRPFVDMGAVTIGRVTKNIKWSTCNMGASYPWEYGDYYAWGAIVPFYQDGYSQESPCTHWIEGKSGYGWDDAPYYKGSLEFSKYVAPGNSFADYNYEDDPARVWWKGNWRVPTYDEWAALCDFDFYKWEYTTDYLGDGSNHAGMIVTRKPNTGPCSGNSIFLPAAGCRSLHIIQDAGYFGYYYASTTPGGHDASGLAFGCDPPEYAAIDGFCRCDGNTIRPVFE